MKKTIAITILFGVFSTLLLTSCEEKSNPRARISVFEMIDSASVPVSGALVKIGPPTQENTLEDVTNQGYTNSSGVIEFEFEKELVLQADAEKLLRDETNQIIYDAYGDPIPIKTGSRTIVLKYDFTDSKTIDVK